MSRRKFEVLDRIADMYEAVISTRSYRLYLLAE
jgi:hypothetical protein